MAAKFVIFALLVASVRASGGFSTFSYSVSDPNTGDVKDQHEKRVGDNVVGKYSLLEADGTKRVVEYAANSATGFNAVVRKEPAAHGAPVAHGASVTHSAAAAHGAHLAAAGPLAHPGPIAPIAPLAPVSHVTHAAQITHAAPYAANTAPLAHGALSAPFASGYGGYNSLASFDHADRSAPSVSSYSHSIIHNAPRPYASIVSPANNGAYGGFGSYGGAYGGYGANGGHGAYGGQGTYGGHSAFGGHGTYGGQGFNAGHSVYGGHGSYSGHGAYRGYNPLAAHGALASPPAHGAYGLGQSAGWSW